jgi:hypothetical protein
MFDTDGTNDTLDTYRYFAVNHVEMAPYLLSAGTVAFSKVREGRDRGETAGAEGGEWKRGKREEIEGEHGNCVFINFLSHFLEYKCDYSQHATQRHYNVFRVDAVD